MIDPNELKSIKKVANSKYNRTKIDMFNAMLDHLMDLNDHVGMAEGGYAKVLIPSDREYVVKWTLAGENDSYKAYARYCKKYGHLHPSLPKIHAMFSNRYFDFYIIEKLNYVAKVSSQFVKDFMEYDARGKMFVSKHNPMALVLKKVQDIGRRYNSDEDIGSVNILCRKDGTPVLSDPLAD